MNDQPSAALGLFPLIFGLAMYVYMSYALMVMAKKTMTPNGWLAWIPIVNVFLMLKVAAKPLWWFLLFLIPFVNIIIAIIVWMKMAERLGKPQWVGVLIIVPLVNIFVPGYLAFSKSGSGGAGMPSQPTSVQGQ